MVHEMKIDAKQPMVRTVEISKEELSDAVVHCSEISLSDMVELLRRKFGHVFMHDDDMLIKDGKWYRRRANSAGITMTTRVFPAGAKAEHIEIYEVIETLRGVMVMSKLKGR